MFPYLLSFTTIVFTSWQIIQYVYFSSLEESLGISSFEVGVLFGVSGIVFFLGNILWGKWIRNIGHKKLLLIGISGLAFSTLFLSLSFSFGSPVLLISSRILYSAFASALPPVLLAIRFSLAKADRATLFNHSRSLAFGRFLGPLFIAATAISGEKASIFMFLLTLTIFVGALQWRFPDDIKTSVDIPTPRKLPVLTALLFTAAVFLGAIQITLGVLVKSRMNMAEVEVTQLVSTLFLLSAAGTVLIQSLGKLWLGISPEVFLLASTVLLAGGTVLYLSFTTKTVLFVAIAIVSVGLSFIHPNVHRLALDKISDVPTGAFTGAHVAGHAVGLLLGSFTVYMPHILITLLLIQLVISARLFFTPEKKAAYATINRS